MKALTSISLCLVIAVGSAAGWAAPSQQQDNKGQREDKIVIGTSEVMVDVVVRDKKGRPVTGLGASDFQVLEDGVPQQILSFRKIDRAAPSSASEPEKPGQPT